MNVDETNPVTPEADSAMPETASLARIAIKRRKSAVADGSEAPRKARKETNPNAPGRIKAIKRGRKAALVFDDSMPKARPVQFDPPPTTPNGSASSEAFEAPDLSAPPPTDSLPAMAAAAAAAPMPTAEPPAEVAPSPDSVGLAAEVPAAELTSSFVEFAEIPMPVDVDIEFVPDPEFCAYADEPMPAEPMPAIETADAGPTPAVESEAKPEWRTDQPSSAEAAPLPSEATPAVSTGNETATAAAREIGQTSSNSEAARNEQSTQRSPVSRFEAIARAARMSALSTAKPGIARTIAVDAARSAEVQKRSTEIFGYWVRAKNGRRFPSRSDFEIAKVAEFWPNSMLLTCDGAPPMAGNHMSFSKVMRLDNGSDGSTSEFNFTSMLIEWILTIGGEAARVGQPVQDTEVFPSSDGTHAYKIVALPLSDHQTQVDHVLCHLTRS